MSSLQEILLLVPLPPRGAWRGCFCTGINTNHSSLSLPVSAVKVICSNEYGCFLLLASPAARGTSLLVLSCAQSQAHRAPWVQDNKSSCPVFSNTLPLHRALAGDTHFGLGASTLTQGLTGPTCQQELLETNSAVLFRIYSCLLGEGC